jgi:copper(I)-binding protein
MNDFTCESKQAFVPYGAYYSFYERDSTVKRMGIVWMLALVVMVAPVAGQMDTTTSPNLVITDVWARPTAMGMGEEMATEEAESDMGMSMGGTSAVYMTITNNGETDLRLIAGETEAANIVEIHESMLGDNDVMMMRPVEGGILIPAGGAVELRPGGLHVMLLEPQELVDGDALTLTLTFAMGEDNMDTVDVVVGAPILEMGPMGMSDLMVDAVSVWARPSGVGMAMGDGSDSGTMSLGTSAVYMTITNPTDSDDALVAAITDVAGIVEIHESMLGDNDVMMMRPVDGGIPIPATESQELRPGGFHVMLLDLPAAIEAGDTITVTLVFESGAEIIVAAPVADRMMMGGM